MCTSWPCLPNQTPYLSIQESQKDSVCANYWELVRYSSKSILNSPTQLYKLALAIMCWWRIVVLPNKSKHSLSQTCSFALDSHMSFLHHLSSWPIFIMYYKINLNDVIALPCGGWPRNTCCIGVVSLHGIWFASCQTFWGHDVA